MLIYHKKHLGCLNFDILFDILLGIYQCNLLKPSRRKEGDNTELAYYSILPPTAMGTPGCSLKLS
jgi:hypothetical protein